MQTSEILPEHHHPNNPPSHDAIAKLAYRLWQEDGEQRGMEKEKEYWRKAESILKGEHHHRHPHDEAGNDPHNSLEGGINPMSHNRENDAELNENERQDDQSLDRQEKNVAERRDNQVQAGINPPVNIANEPVEQGVNPVDTNDPENRNKGVNDNTEDKDPANTDKSGQPPIGGSEETDQESVTRTQTVGPLVNQGDNGGPVDPTATAADSLQNK